MPMTSVIDGEKIIFDVNSPLNRGKDFILVKRSHILVFWTSPQNGSSLLILIQALYSPLSLISLLVAQIFLFTPV